MITGFENVTHELNAEELKLATALIQHFKKKTKSNPVTAKEIVEGVNKTYKLSFKFTDVRLRKIINYYRTNAIMPILSNSNGYYVSYDINEIRECNKSMTQRATSIFDCVYGLEKIIKQEIEKSKNVEQKKIF